jgi:beta-lactam-binding protein with PASTA domain
VVDEAPRTLAGRYEVGELIGRGGMAEVHIGHDNRLGRTVAIKILRSDLARDPSFQARFRREAQSAAALNHPAIVAVYDTGEDTFTEPSGAVSHVPFIVMEYVEGHTVRDILQDGNAVPIEEAVEITSGVLSALEYSHHAGIVHRDIKPANVMLTPTGAIKVMDFGIARALADSAATMTQTQAVIGTAQYLSPEQARGESVDARSDLYSTGCLLFELLTGRPPFTGDSPVSVAYQHVREAPVSPSSIASDVPETLDRVTLKALAKERTARYGSAAEFRSDLEAAIRGGALAAGSLGAVVAASAATGPAEGATEIFSSVTDDATKVAPAFAPVTTADPLAELATEEDEEKPKHRALLWTLVVIAVLAVAAIAAMLLLDRDSTPPVETANVPVLTDMSREQITAALTDAGFTEPPEFFEEVNNDVAPGLFIRSDPAVGDSVPVTTAVQVWTSTGPEDATVPDVTGFTQAQATEAIEAEGLVVAVGITSESSPKIARDSVTRTEPAAGTGAKKGDEVRLYVASGQVDLPDLTGMTQAEAVQALSDLGLTGSFTNTPTNDVEAGRVVSQSPNPGSVNQGARIDVAIAEAIPVATVPANLVGMTFADAQKALGDAGLGVQLAPGTLPSPTGRVVSSNPAGGTEVEPGSVVVLTFEPEPSADPSDEPSDDASDGANAGNNGNNAGKPGKGNA